MPDTETLAVIPFEQCSTGYDFIHDRWEGEAHWDHARSAALHWQAEGFTANVYEGEATEWKGSKKIAIPTFRVWIKHPRIEILYAWWSPFTHKHWFDPISVTETTWFEFPRPKEDKK